ncbi:MAG: ATP-binding protein, partial [Myxococcota bacterium]
MDEAGSGYRLRVADDGVGVRPEDLESPNTLGLLLVRSLVDQLGGRLDVERANGLVFTITFSPELDDYTPALKFVPKARGSGGGTS